MDDLLGRTLGQYQIIEEVGRGGMAVVYRAYQPSLNRYVAIKVLPPQFTFDEQFIERFQREARAAAGLRHPSIVVIYDVGQQGGLHYIAMEYLEGRTLKELVEQEGSLPPHRATRIVEQVADALDYAHQRGFVHRDVKPANIFVGRDDHATLTDFGIAKAASETQHLTRTGMLMGTPEYMSPEQAQGQELDHRTDIYALAVVAYQMLSGQVPFSATTPHAVLYKHIHEPPPPLRSLRPGLPSALEGVLDKGLAKDPRVRYRTAGGLAQGLGQAVAGRRMPVAAPEAPPKVVVAPPSRQAARPVPAARPRSTIPTWLWVIGGLAVVIVIAGVILLAAGGSDGEPTVPPSSRGAATLAPTAVTAGTTALPPPTASLVPSATTSPATDTPTPSPTPTPTPDRGELERALLEGVQWRSGNGTPIFAYYAHQAPTMDGHLDEWTGTLYGVNHIVFQAENWQGAADLSAGFFAAWDEDFLYLGLDIVDDVHVQTSGGKNLYKGDDVEIQIDANLAGDYSQSALSDDDGQVGLTVKDFGSGQYEAYIWRPPAREGPLSVSLAARQTSNPSGYMLEVAVPWWVLNLSPRVETPYGFCLSLADTDTPGSGAQESMASTAPNRTWGDPTTWGTLILVDW